MERPTETGRDLAKLRLSLGLSVSRVAAVLNTSHHNVARWENSLIPLDAEKALRWKAALRSLAEERSVSLAEQGWRVRDLPSGYRRAIASLSGR